MLTIRNTSFAVWFGFCAMLVGCQSLPPVINATNLSDVDFSKVRDFKMGESCQTYILGIIPVGASRVTQAVRDAKITQLKVIEYEARNYILFSQMCLLAYGL